MTTERKPYTVTERAGTRVAGRVVTDRAEPLLLTAAEAEHELREGTIVPEGGTLDDAWSKPSAEMDALRVEAGRVKAIAQGRETGSIHAPAPDGPAPEEPPPAAPAAAKPSRAAEKAVDAASKAA